MDVVDKVVRRAMITALAIAARVALQPKKADAMEHEIPHDLQPEQARKVAHQAVQHYAERFAKYSPQVTWTDEQRVAVAFTVKGVRLEGGITVEPGAFRMRLEVPFLLRPFSGRALKVIDTEVRSWIAKAKAGAV